MKEKNKCRGIIVQFRETNNTEGLKILNGL